MADLLDDLLDNPRQFYQTHFASAPRDHVVVLEAVPEAGNLILGVYDTACDQLRLKVEQVPCATGMGPPQRNGRRSRKGDYSDMVLGRDIAAIDRVANELKEYHEEAQAQSRRRAC